MNCIDCSKEISDSSSFCKYCGFQNICKSCKAQLEKDSSFCNECGEVVIKVTKQESAAINHIQYNQKGNSKSLDAKFTDNVGGYLTSLFNGVIFGQHSAPTKNPFQKNISISTNKGLSSSSPTPINTSNIEDAEIVDVDYTELIAKIFKQNENGKLEVIDNRLKEKSNFDKMKRLSVLFVFAKKLAGIEITTREDLNEIIGREKLADGNYRNFLKKDGLKYFSVKESGGFSLLAGGEDYAKEILNQIASPDFKATTSKGGRKPNKKISIPSPDSTSNKSVKNNSSHKLSALEMCKSLIKENFFDTKKKLNDVVKFCEEKKGEKYTPQNISIALKRLLQDKLLDRETSKDGGYEYWKK